MDKSELYSRRNFIKKSAIAGSVLFMPVYSMANDSILRTNSEGSDLKVFIFSKHLQFLDYKSLSEAAKEMGFDGVDLTVRPKGHVLPEKVAEDLPTVTEAMKAVGLLPHMLSTNVIDANNPIHIKVLEVASQLGYQYYRTDWIRYFGEKDIFGTVENAKLQFAALVELNKKFGIKASYQNHSGHFFGASIWDLYQVLEELSPAQIGSQYDISHATVEGGKNWEVGLELIKPYINTQVVKDFIWVKHNNKWMPKYTPLGEGMVDFKRYFSLLKKYNIHVPMSIHVEYDLGGAERGGIPSIGCEEVLRRIKKDLTFVRRLWKDIE